MRVFKNVVRGFSLVHDPEGSHYENPDEAKSNSLRMTSGEPFSPGIDKTATITNNSLSG